MAKENDVRFIRLWFTDILGVLKSLQYPLTNWKGHWKKEWALTAHRSKVLRVSDESDMVAKPDPDTFQILPWRPLEHNAVARMFCDILKPGGEPFEGDPAVLF